MLNSLIWYLIFGVQTSCWLWCKLVYSLTTPPASMEQFSQSYRDAVPWALSPKYSHCQLQTGTCQEHCQRLNKKNICHLPPRRLNPVRLQLLTFNTPWVSSVWGKALCAPGNLVRQLFRWLDVFRNWFYDLNPLYLLISRKALNPFMVTSDPQA